MILDSVVRGVFLRPFGTCPHNRQSRDTRFWFKEGERGSEKHVALSSDCLEASGETGSVRQRLLGQRDQVAFDSNGRPGRSYMLWCFILQSSGNETGRVCKGRDLFMFQWCGSPIRYDPR